METFTKTNKSKKLILILVLLMLFNFCCPKNIAIAAKSSIGDIDSDENKSAANYTANDTGDTGGWLDLSTNFASLLFFMERGIIGLINNIFSDSLHQYHYYVTDMGDYKEVDIDLFLSPESIIKGRYLLFNADIFDDVSDVEKDEPEKYYDDARDKSTVTGKTSLRETISGWYTALRTFSIVALLSVLVYVGIRMVISTIAQDKAKYKVMFKDWLVALCLLIVMHYIMIAILDISNLIVDAIGSSGAAGSQTEAVMEKIGTITAARDEYEITYNNNTTEGVRAIYADENKKNLELYTIGDAYAYEFLLVAILFYTILFAIKYLKREFTIMFLILLGPISCITYPIDKISDGKAQAFNKWFTEFLYQVIIQPFHLLIYIVLVGTATDLANDNILYSIVCFAVMIPAEKFIKEMFGFRDKLGSPLGAMATGAAASQIFNKLKSGSSGGSKSSNSGDNDSTPNTLPPKTVDDKKDLVAGEGSNSPRIGARDNNPSGTDAIEGGNLPSAEALDTAGDVATAAGVTDAIDEATDNSANGDRTTLDEQMSEAQEQKDIQRQIDDKVDDATEDVKNDKEKDLKEDTNPAIDDKQSKWERIKNSKPVGFVGNKAKQALSIHNQRMAKKWGSTSRGRRWVNRGKNTAKFLAKTGVGLLAGGVAVMAGKGTQGFAAGVVGGYALTGKAMNSVSNVASDYIGGMRSDKGREKHAFNEFRGNSKQIDKAVMSYRENHDGVDPSRSQLNDEMEDRFELSRYGLSDDQIDDVIGIYQDKKQELMDAGRTEDDAKRIAASQAKYTSKLASQYSAKDFRDSKKMEAIYGNLVEGLQDEAKCSKEVAEDFARQYLINAGKVNGVGEQYIRIPDRKETKRIPIPNSSNFHGKWNFEEKQEDQNIQLERFSELQAELIAEGGYNREDIDIIVKTCSGKSNVELVDSFEAKVKYLTDSNVNKEAEIHVNKVEEGNELTDVQIKEKVKIEKIERLGVMEATGIKNNEKAITEIRKMETKQGTTEYREIGGKAIKGELSKNDKNNMAEKELNMSEKYKSIANAQTHKENPNTASKKKKGKNK